MLDTSESFAEISTRSRKKVPALQGRIVFNLFFENSTQNAHQLQPGGQAALGGHPGLLTERVEPVEGRIVHRHRQEHRSHGGRRRGGAASHAGHAAHAGSAPEVFDHQCRRRGPRASHAGAPRPHDDPPRQGEDRGADRRLAGRHFPFPGRAVQHLGADQAGGQGHPVRAADPGAQGLGANGVRGLLSPRRGVAAVRRRERVAHPVRAPAGGAVSFDWRVFAVLHDDPGEACAWPRAICFCWRLGR